MEEEVSVGGEGRVDPKGTKAILAQWERRDRRDPQVKPVHRALKVRREKRALEGTTVRWAHKAPQVVLVPRVSKVTKDLQVWLALRECRGPLELQGQW